MVNKKKDINMKIRNGFVSNSSSSSFCIFGVNLTTKEYEALAQKEINAMKADAEKNKPKPIPACGHKFDRAVIPYCSLCGKPSYEVSEDDEDYEDYEDYDIAEMISESEFAKKNKLDVVNTGSDGDLDICIGFDLSSSTLKGAALIAELTRVNDILAKTYTRKAGVFSGELYN